MSSAGGERDPLLSPASESDFEREGHSPSLRTRLVALGLLFLLSTGANWTEACLGPLKATLLSDLQINNTQYGIISASTQLANTVVPIFTGLWIDRLGASRMAIFATATVCIGAAMSTIACHATSFPLLVISRIVQGMGVIIIDTAATKLIVHWSRGTGWLGAAISCNFALDRAASAISKALAIPIAQIGPASDDLTKASKTFDTAAYVSLLSLLAALLYMRHEKKHLRKSLVTNISSGQSTFDLLAKAVNTLPVFFVLLAVSQFYQPIAIFNNLSADILRWKGHSPRVAGYLVSVGQVLPIVIAPFLGRFFDRFGHRLEFVPLTAILLGTSFGLLLWSKGSSLPAMVIFSLGNALNTPPYLCSLAILLREEATFGCSWGIWKSLMQSNQIIMNITLGRLQDRTTNRGYEGVLLVLFASKGVEMMWGALYVVVDHRYACRILSSNEEEWRKIEENHPNSLSLTASAALRPSGLSTRIIVAYLCGVMAAAWLLFLSFSWLER